MRFLFLLVLALPALCATAGSYQVEEDIEFAKPGGVSVRMDAHIPPGKGPFPAVILVHGGGWSAGDKAHAIVKPLFEPLTGGSFAWFTINYRLAPEYPYPAAVEDVESAILFVKQHAKQYKVDRKRIALMGESAGGHLVNLVGARNRRPYDVAAVVCFYGPFDMVEWGKILQGKPVAKAITGFFRFTEWNDAAFSVLREASPSTYLSRKTPPFLVIHGTKDDAVLYDQALLALELFKKAGVPCRLITIQDGVHGVVNWEKDPKFQGYKPEMVAWLHKTLGK